MTDVLGKILPCIIRSPGLGRSLPAEEHVPISAIKQHLDMGPSGQQQAFWPVDTLSDWGVGGPGTSLGLV